VTPPDPPASAQPAPRIQWFGDDGTEHCLDLEARDGPVTIGRREGNTIALAWDPQVSRVHAQLERVGSEWTVRDDGLSRNGTWVNGQRLRGSRRLLDGDTVRVGRTLLVVHGRPQLDSLLTVGATGSESDAVVASVRIVISVCGALKLEIDGRRREADLSGRKGRLLFAYLVANRHRVVRREQLAEVLWPRNPPASPEEGLNVHIARLRTVLGKTAVTGRSDVRLELGDDVIVDIETARARHAEAARNLAEGNPAASIRAARAALNILRQDFMPEFDDDEWVREVRIELQNAIPQLIEIEAEAALSLGGADLPLAEAAAKALLELRPYRESDYRLLMRAHVASGNAIEALLVYERLRQRLMDDLGVPPTTETRALYERLLAEESAGVS
jgi:SARP family transcriptional regulator, regulator of embCAB operon